MFLDNPGWQEVFLHPKETSGTLVQVVQARKQNRPAPTLDDVLGGRGSGGNGEPSS